MKRVAFLTMDSLADFVDYDPLAVAPLAERDWQVEWVSWRARDVDWNAFDLVVIRSTWDYQKDPDSFLAVLSAIESSGVPLANPLSIVRWNFDKRYLRDLEGRGISIVPTHWGEASAGDIDLAALRGELGSDTIVIKPTIGANADDTYRVDATASPAFLELVQSRYAERPFLAQPFISSVVEQGEYSLFYFDGRYSHATLKKPQAGDFRVQEEHGGKIRSIEPDAALRAAAEGAVNAIGTRLLYARADLVVLADGSPALIELELIEPSLYFSYDPASPIRFADAVNSWCDRLSVSSRVCD